MTTPATTANEQAHAIGQDLSLAFELSEWEAEQETGTAEYLRELDKLSLRDVGRELDGLKKWQLVELATDLSVSSRYADNVKKPKAVLVAAVYEALRVRRAEAEDRWEQQGRAEMYATLGLSDY